MHNKAIYCIHPVAEVNQYEATGFFLGRLRVFTFQRFNDNHSEDV